MRPGAASGRREHVDDATRDQWPGPCRIGRHVRRGCMRLEGVNARPFLDHDESVGAEPGLETLETLGIDRGPVFDAALLRAHGCNIATECFEHRVALAGLGRDECDNMDHMPPPRLT